MCLKKNNQAIPEIEHHYVQNLDKPLVSPEHLQDSCACRMSCSHRETGVFLWSCVVLRFHPPNTGHKGPPQSSYSPKSRFLAYSLSFLFPAPPRNQDQIAEKGAKRLFGRPELRSGAPNPSKLGLCNIKPQRGLGKSK